MEPELCISNELPGNTDAAGPWGILGSHNQHHCITILSPVNSLSVHYVTSTLKNAPSHYFHQFSLQYYEVRSIHHITSTIVIGSLNKSFRLHTA